MGIVSELIETSAICSRSCSHLADSELRLGICVRRSRNTNAFFTAFVLTI